MGLSRGLVSLLLLVAAPWTALRHNPVSSFTVSPGSGPPPLSVSVDGSASIGAHGPITSYTWTWGDGSPDDTGSTASHAYAATGTYTITLVVRESAGLSAASSRNVHCLTAGNAPPTADPIGAVPTSGDAPLLVAFTGSGQDPTPAGDVLEHRWNYGDGSAEDVFTGLAPGQTSAPSHTFAAPGSFTVTLTVRDSENVADTRTIPIVATAGGVPFASFTRTPSAGPPGFTVNVDASASFDSNGTITSYAWAWGDGSPMSSGITAPHAYTATGTYTIRLTVTDDSALTSFVEQTVNCMTPGNLTPSSIIQNVLPPAGYQPLPVTFFGLGHDDNGPLVHEWDFGDGSSLVTYPGVANHGTTTPNHLYLLPGTYTVSLSVKDSENLTTTSTTTVTVIDPATSPEKLGRRACGSTGLEPLIVLLLARRRRRRPA